MVNPNNLIIEIPEYKSSNLRGLNVEKDLSYLKKDCFKYQTRAPYRIRELKDCVEIENKSYSGIIQLDTCRLHFSTKVKTNLFYMLSFLKDESCFLYDPDNIIEIKEGDNFFDILGRLYLNELTEILRKGIYKKYIRKQENELFLRGKLLISKQICNDLGKRPKFHCSYENLTYDNLENRIVLRAATLLVPLIRFNEEIRSSLNCCCQQLKAEVSLVDVTAEDCNRVQFCKLNEQYEPIIQLAKAILQYYFIRSVQAGASRGFNFIVDMNHVYEDFITELVKELIEEDALFDNYVLDRQEEFNSLVEERRIVTKPDIILRRKDTDNYPIIIDAKYKKQDNNADYYQIIAYALAIPSSKACCLIYPSDENIDESPLTLRNYETYQRKIRIFPIQIDLSWDKEWKYDTYINCIKRELKIKLSNAMKVLD
jgi:5-methylcytosine-specific restriction enzyme subunit McrC